MHETRSPSSKNHYFTLSKYSAEVTSHFAEVTSHFAEVTSHFAEVTSHFAEVTSHFAGVTSHFAGVTKHFALTSCQFISSATAVDEHAYGSAMCAVTGKTNAVTKNISALPQSGIDNGLLTV